MYFQSIASVPVLLREFLPKCKTPTAVLAGHYRVAMTTEGLRDALWSPELYANSKGSLHMTLLEMGTFPEQTLLLGAEALNLLPQKSQVWLLCNDTLRRFGKSESNLPTDHGELRRAYYRQKQFWFEQLLNREGHDAQQIIRSNNAKRTVRALLPSTTLLYSERVLERRWEKRRRKRGDLATLIEEVDKVTSSRCGAGAECSCSRTLAELLFQMHEAGNENVVMFIPHACKEAVAETVKIIWRETVLFKNMLIIFSGKKIVNEQTGEIDFPEALISSRE